MHTTYTHLYLRFDNGFLFGALRGGRRGLELGRSEAEVAHFKLHLMEQEGEHARCQRLEIPPKLCWQRFLVFWVFLTVGVMCFTCLSLASGAFFYLLSPPLPWLQTLASYTHNVGLGLFGPSFFFKIFKCITVWTFHLD